MSVLLLNASYEPLTVVSWKRAVTLVFTGRAEMVEQDGDRVIRSAGGVEFPRPMVVRLVRMVAFASLRSRRPPSFSKAGLTARDEGLCQVTGCEEAGDTVDHLVPRALGGATSWENCVLMCADHNAAKADITLDRLGWALKRRPRQPAAALVLRDVRSRPEWQQWVAPASA